LEERGTGMSEIRGSKDDVSKDAERERWRSKLNRSASTLMNPALEPTMSSLLESRITLRGYVLLRVKLRTSVVRAMDVDGDQVFIDLLNVAWVNLTSGPRATLPRLPLDTTIRLGPGSDMIVERVLGATLFPTIAPPYETEVNRAETILVTSSQLGASLTLAFTARPIARPLGGEARRGGYPVSLNEMLSKQTADCV
jgi:hypothetical protein